MHIVATSDLHGVLPEIQPCDVLVIAGDVCPNWDHGIAFQRDWLTHNFTDWLDEVPAEFIIGIGGNHDFALEKDWDLASALPWYYLLDESVEFDGVKFYGSPWVPNLSRWAFHRTDEQLDEKFAAIPDDTDVLIVHGPPFLLSDRTCPDFGNVHAGFPGMRNVLDRVRPALYVCGHIHEAYGFSQYNSTIVANVSYMTERYKPINPPVMFEIVNGVLTTFGIREGEAFGPSVSHYAEPQAFDLSAFNACP